MKDLATTVEVRFAAAALIPGAMRERQDRWQSYPVFELFILFTWHYSLDIQSDGLCRTKGLLSLLITCGTVHLNELVWAKVNRIGRSP